MVINLGECKELVDGGEIGFLPLYTISIADVVQYGKVIG